MCFTLYNLLVAVLTLASLAEAAVGVQSASSAEEEDVCTQWSILLAKRQEADGRKMGVAGVEAPDQLVGRQRKTLEVADKAGTASKEVGH